METSRRLSAGARLMTTSGLEGSPRRYLPDGRRIISERVLGVSESPGLHSSNSVQRYIDNQVPSNSVRNIKPLNFLGENKSVPQVVPVTQGSYPSQPHLPFIQESQSELNTYSRAQQPRSLSYATIETSMGLTLQQLPDGTVRISAITNRNFEKSDVRVGDLIGTVEGINIRDMPLQEVSRMINVSDAEQVQLGLFRYHTATISRNGGVSPTPRNEPSSQQQQLVPALRGQPQRPESLRSPPPPPPPPSQSRVPHNMPRPRHTFHIQTSKSSQHQKPPPAFVRDPQGESQLAVMIRQRKAMGTRDHFQDPEFPAIPQSFGNAAVLATFPPLAPVDFGRIIWRHPEHLINDKAVETFVNHVEADDILIGSLSVTYLLAAMGCVACNELLIQDIIVDDGRDMGIYGVKFYFEGLWHTIIVDSRIPCDSRFDNRPLSLCWNLVNPKEIWALIVEKAFAKLHGSYCHLQNGYAADALVYLTGGFKRSIGWNPTLHSDADTDKIWNETLQILRGSTQEAPVFVTACLQSEEVISGSEQEELTHQLGLLGDHGYLILLLDNIPGIGKVVKLRNPWARTIVNGTWGEADRRWDQSSVGNVREMLRMPAGSEEDGTFVMDWSSFCNEFFLISTVTIFPSHYSHCAVRGLFGPDVVGDASVSTSDISLVVDTEAVFLQIEQPDVRYMRHKRDIGFRQIALVVADQFGTKVFETQYQRDRVFGVSLQLNPGSYLVHCWSHPTGRTANNNTFTLSAWSPGPLRLENLDDPAATIPQHRQSQAYTQARQNAHRAFASRNLVDA